MAQRPERQAFSTAAMSRDRIDRHIWTPAPFRRTLGRSLLVVLVVLLGLALAPAGQPKVERGGEASAVPPQVTIPASGTDLRSDSTEGSESDADVDLGRVELIGNWGWYGYRLNRAETNQIANLSLWSAVSGVSGSRLIPYSGAIMRLYAVNWVLTARNARSIGQCLAISYAGTGLIVGC